MFLYGHWRDLEILLHKVQLFKKNNARFTFCNLKLNILNCKKLSYV